MLLDPVYSGKGLAGMIGLIGQKFLTPKRMFYFLHTGGAVALFAYGNQFSVSAE